MIRGHGIHDRLPAARCPSVVQLLGFYSALCGRGRISSRPVAVIPSASRWWLSLEHRPTRKLSPTRRTDATDKAGVIARKLLSLRRLGPRSGQGPIDALDFPKSVRSGPDSD